ncbi:hypothetical protein PR202_gb29646 [Eleusine coracana subsp. coracana]|uniref:Uncharacterized protein n=1 Tax=Eleusine coracana subsp. coracana TaxID=191504 RepID=A0AAV5G109_ELECO|nr:hypothetical protein PR202_gb29646 [Eleusine coracana subsp. coracana]
MMDKQSRCFCNGFVYVLANSGKISLRPSYLVLQSNAPDIVTLLLSEPQPEVRASAVFALGNLLDVGSSSLSGVDDDSDDDEKMKAEINVVRSLLQVSSDGSPLVRSEVATALTRFALGHNKHLKSVAAEYWKPQTSSLLKSLPSLANINNPTNVYSSTNILQGSSGLASHIGPVLRVGSDSSGTGRDGRISTSSPIATSSILHGSPQSDDSSQHSDSGILLRENATNGGLSYNRVWNYDDALPVNAFENHKSSDRGLSKLLLINELDESLLLAASSDGKCPYMEKLHSKRRTETCNCFLISSGSSSCWSWCCDIDWQQQSGYLYASGDMASILVWDLDKEQLTSTIQSSADSAISALSISQVRSGQFAAGFADASIRIFDVRTPDRIVYMARPHAPRTEKVVGIGFQPGFDPHKIVSASQAGDIQFLDVRRAAEPYLTIEAHRGSLTALAVHRHAPVLASGSAKQMIKVFSLEERTVDDNTLSTIFHGPEDRQC